MLAERTDVREPSQVRTFVRRVNATFGAVDILMNNAGITSVGAFAEQPYERIGTVIDVNLKGLMYMSRAVLPALIAQGDVVIINVASDAGLTGFPDLVSYCASKSGVVGFTESPNQEVAQHGVRVYAICPVRVATDMQVQYSDAKVGIKPEQVAARIVQLAGSNPRARTGTCIPIG